MRSTYCVAQSLDFKELSVDCGCGLAGLQLITIIRQGVKRIGLYSRSVSAEERSNGSRGGGSEVKLPALSQKTRQERGTLGNCDE